MSETPKIQHSEAKDFTVLSDEQEVEAMAAQPAKTSETEVQDDRYSRLKHRFNALKKEYLILLQNWEESNQRVSQLSEERKFLRDKLQFFLRSSQFSGKVTDEDLALALLARSQSGHAAGGISHQSTLQIEQLLSLVSLAQQKQQQVQQPNAKQLSVTGGSSKSTKAAIAAAAAAAAANAAQMGGEFAKPQVNPAPTVATKNANTITIMQKPNESKEITVADNVITSFEDNPKGIVLNGVLAHQPIQLDQLQQSNLQQTLQNATSVQQMQQQTQAHVMQAKNEQEFVYILNSTANQNGNGMLVNTSKRQKTSVEQQQVVAAAGTATQVKIHLGNQMTHTGNVGSLMGPGSNQAFMNQSQLQQAQATIGAPQPAQKKPRKRKEPSLSAQQAKQLLAAEQLRSQQVVPQVVKPMTTSITLQGVKAVLDKQQGAPQVMPTVQAQAVLNGLQQQQVSSSGQQPGGPWQVPQTQPTAAKTQLEQMGVLQQQHQHQQQQHQSVSLMDQLTLQHRSRQQQIIESNGSSKIMFSGGNYMSPEAGAPHGNGPKAVVGAMHHAGDAAMYASTTQQQQQQQQAHQQHLYQQAAARTHYNQN